MPSRAKDSQRGDPGRQPREIFGARICKQASAVITAVPFMIASASFGRKRSGAMPARFERCGGRQRRAVVQDFAFAAQHRGEIGQRRQIAAGAHRAFARESPVKYPAGASRVSCSNKPTLTPENPLHREVKPGRDHSACFAGREMRAQTATVKGVEMTRQLGDQLRLDGHRAGIAEAGGDAINHSFFSESAVEEIGAARDRGAKSGAPR